MDAGITIIGLGQGDLSNLSAENKQFFLEAQKVYVKSENYDALRQLTPFIEQVTPVIDPVDGLSDGYRELAITIAKNAPALYAVPGDPFMDEASTVIIQELAAQARIPVKIIAGEALLPDVLAWLTISPTTGLQIIDATLLCSYHYPPLEAHRPALITGLYHPDLRLPLKRVLGHIHPAHTSVTTLVNGQPASIRLADLANMTDGDGYLYIPARPDSVGLTHFQEIIAHLRAPNGCPWDRKQTHQTLRPYLLEETYEVLAALDAADSAGLADELGDLLLQIALHAQIAAEAGTFNMSAIINHISQKMIRRHPHVFGDSSARDSEEVEVNWDAIKAREKAEKGESPPEPSVMDAVLPTMPALVQTLDISKKAVKQGFEWDDAQGVLRKLMEEAQEITEATSKAEIEAEIGDFLFTAVNLARKFDVDAESALRACNTRFMRRFRRVERLARQQNLILSEINKATWFNLWQQAKQDVAHME